MRRPAAPCRRRHFPDGTDRAPLDDPIAARRAAEQTLMAAAQRYREVRLARSMTAVYPDEGSRWPRLAGTVIGAGALLGGMAVGFIVTAYVRPGPVLVLPAAAALAALIAVTVLLRPVHRRPVVADLVRAEIELRRAEAELLRAREAAAALEPTLARPAIPPDVRRLVEAATRGYQPAGSVDPYRWDT